MRENDSFFASVPGDGSSFDRLATDSIGKNLSPAPILFLRGVAVGVLEVVSKNAAMQATDSGVLLWTISPQRTDRIKAQAKPA